MPAVLLSKGWPPNPQGARVASAQHTEGSVRTLPQLWRKMKHNEGDGVKRSYFKYFLLWFTVVAEHLEKPSK